MTAAGAPWWLRLVGWLVPRSARQEWLREWSAELQTMERGAGPVGRARARATCFLAAVEDAAAWRGRTGASGGVSDLRYALRSLARSPTFVAVSVATLALGIGANAAIWSVVRTVLLRPLPYDDESGLVDVRLSFRGHEHGAAADFPIPASEPEYLELRDSGVGLDLAGYWTGDVNLDGGDSPVRVSSASVTANFFEVLGVRPALGRTFRVEEDLPGNGSVAVLSHGLWVRAFAGDAAVLGRTIRLNGGPYTVVGVLPETFVFPGPAADVIRPNVIDPSAPSGRSSHYITMIGRLAAGGGVAPAQARVTAQAERWEAEYPGRHGISPTHPITLVPLRESMVGDTGSALMVLLGVVGLVLVIASANIASLVLVRLEHRQSETAVRVALGAGVRGVVTPFLAESLVVAAAGAGCGLLLAAGATRAVELWGPAELGRLGRIGVDAPVVAFTALVTIGAAILFGLVPTLLATRRGVQDRIRSGGRGSISGGPKTAARSAMVVAEVTLAVVIVIGAGLLVRSFAELRSVESGLEPSGVVTMDFSLTSADYPTPGDVTGFHTLLGERLAAIPGVLAAASIRSLPFGGTPGVESMKPVDRPVAEDEFWNAQYQIAGEEVFSALGVPVLEGRGFTSADRAGASPVAVINRAMADAYWPGGSPVGSRVKFGHPDGPNPVLTIVGVVGDIRQGGYRDDVPAQIWVPRAQAGAIYEGMATRFATLVVRSDLPPVAAMAAAREAIRAVDPRLPVANVRTMSSVMAGSVTDERFLAGVVSAFSLLALTLGAVGVGGLVAYTVKRRTRELGLRIALGAERTGILWRLLGHALALAVTGSVIGTAIALAGGRLLESHLFGISATDPLVFVAAPLTLVLAALAAAWAPALRATRIPPTEAMRSV